MWRSTQQAIVWYGTASAPVALQIDLEFRLAEGENVQFKLACANRTMNLNAYGKGSEPVRAQFETFRIREPGPIRMELKMQGFSGAVPPTITALLVRPTDHTKVRLASHPRRNAASIHLGYPLKQGEEAAAFYNEVTAYSDPLYSFYMACGWRRGYFGIQVNSPTERRVLFSVWDSGSEAVDRAKVGAENRVQLVEAGAGVVAGDFGNEGTGGQSFLRSTWKTGTVYRFLVTAKAEGDTTLYSGFFFAPEYGKWRLIARFRAPKDGKLLSGLYSFSENYVGVNGQLQRKAWFSNQWINTGDGWRELTTARFTHDSHGKADRWDYAAGIDRGDFFLEHGGFTAQGVHYGDTLSRPAAGKRPKDIEPLLK
jgi:hypothetical protein